MTQLPPVKASAIPYDGVESRAHVVLRKKRGPKKVRKTKAEQELDLMTPRMRDLAEGRLSVEDLDFEELCKGQLKDKNGKFSGRKPGVLPRDWTERIAKEIILRGESEFRKNFDGAMLAMTQLALGERTPAREKLAASQYIIERVMGKIPDKVETKTEVTVFEQLVQGGELLVDLGEQDALEATEVSHDSDASSTSHLDL